MTDDKSSFIRNYSVYIHIVPSIISGYDHDKYYVGITCKKPIERWGKDGNGYKYQPFIKAIRKYGWNNIQHEIIASHLNEQEAKKFEQTLISILHSRNPKYGYNRTDGGDLPSCHNGIHHAARSVVLLNTGQIYETLKSAAEDNNLHSSRLYIYGVKKKRCCKRDINNNILVFMYYEDYINFSQEEIQKIIQTETKYQGLTKQKDSIVC